MPEQSSGPPSYAALTWADLLDLCSRIHTTRTRPGGPWENAEPREDSHTLDVLIAGKPARITPTRMHEPGFYYWQDDEPRRSDEDLAALREAVERGEVVRA